MNQFRVVTPPADMPVTVAEVKVDARIDHDDDNTLLESLIAAATTRAEDWARRAFVTRTYELALDCWPGNGIVALPMPPLASVTAVKYYDWDNMLHTVAPGEYIVYSDVEPGMVSPIYTQWWPPAQLRPVSPIRITFTAGYGDAAAVPETFRQLIRALVVLDYEHRDGMTPDGERKLGIIRARLQADWGW